MYVSSIFSFLSSYGLNVTILGFCVSGSTVAVHFGDAGLNPTSLFCIIE